MAFTVSYALFGSMLMALTLIPVLATYLFRHAPRSWENPVLRWLYARYERALRGTIAYPGSGRPIEPGFSGCSAALPICAVVSVWP